MGIQYIGDITVNANPTNGSWINNIFGLLETITVVPNTLTGASLTIQQEFVGSNGAANVITIYTSPVISGNDVFYPSKQTEDSAGLADARTLIPLRNGARWRFQVTGAISGSVQIWVGML